MLDDLAYAAQMRDLLLESEAIGEEQLAELAQARAGAIRTAFLAGGEFAENRVQLAAATTVESEDGEWVTLELGVVSE